MKPVIGLDRTRLDLTDADAIRRIIRDTKPSVIVNAAAYTAVDKAESEPELAFTVNAIAPGVMAEEAARLDVPLIHYSTDYDYDGRKTTPYVESDATTPQSVYGKSKLAGEQAIQAVDLPHLILRTSWVYGSRGKNFLLTMLRLAREREELKVVADQMGTPTSCRSIANATAIMLDGWDEGKSGTYHLTCAGETSWHGFAQAILRFYEAQRVAYDWLPLRVHAEDIVAIPTADFPTAAARPAYSVMNNTKILLAFQISMPLWSEALSAVVRELRVS